MEEPRQFDFLSAVDAIDAIERVNEPREAFNRLADYARTFGFTSVAIGHISNPALSGLREPMRMSSWPREWVEHWIKHALIISDPIARMAYSQHASFKWSEAFRRQAFDNRAQRLFRELGFSEGLAIPVRTGAGPMGCVSLGCDRFDLTSREQAALELAATHCFVRVDNLLGAASPAEEAELTRRETEILHFVAAGKSNWEIGAILSISEFHVRDCLKAVFKKLNAVSRAHAVAMALRRNIILP